MDILDKEHDKKTLRRGKDFIFYGTLAYKRCTRCGVHKPFTSDYYIPSGLSWHGATPHCKECESKAKRGYNRRPEVKANRHRNRVRDLSKEREYYRSRLGIRRERERARRRIDPSFSLNNRMRERVWHVIREGKAGKSWKELVGYSVKDLKRRLESQFTEGMTWRAFMAGEIHIDHIRPISSFNITSYECDDFKACWSLNNLQPLWREENLQKGARYERN